MMNQEEAHAEGRYHGRAAANYAEAGDSDKREAGCGCAEGECCRECLTRAAFESEANARQFSPWEFLAHGINECEDRAGGLWEAYERGVAAGIRKGVAARLRGL
jgi:hypothetical protein